MSTKRLLLAGLLLLTACGTPAVKSPPPTPPQPGHTLGLFELGFNQGQEATVRPITEQAATSPLTFTQTGMVNLVDTTNQVVHMTATFKVFNRSGFPVALPTFIPMDTDGTLATDGLSPFRNVRTRTGAQVSPSGMAVEAVHMDSAGSIIPDPTATTFLTNIASGALTVDLPAGTTATSLSRRGWQGTQIAPRTIQNVTFSVRVPIQGSELSDTDPFAFNLVLAVADNPGTIADLRGIYEVQGNTPSGDAISPLADATVKVEGVVTSVHTANTPGSLKGFFVQEETVDTDGVATTSDGIFVYCSASCPSVSTGDLVRVSGTVSDYFGATQITTTAAADTTTLGSGLPLPAATPLTLPLPVASRERYEGMRVSASGVVTNNYTLGRGASFDIAQQRIMNFTQMNAPSVSGYAAFKAALPEKTIRIDDGTRFGNPDPVIFARGQQNLSATHTLRGGDDVTVTGVLTYSNDGWTNSGSVDTYRIHATQLNVNITDGNPRLNAPPSVNGTTNANLVTRVGAMNVLNYFTTLASTNSGCTPNLTDKSSRGANTCEEFIRQQTKIVEAISGLNPDVLGLMEMQNDFDKGAGSSVANLVNALNAKAGADTYAYINPTTKIGTDAISLAMIYKPAAVTPVGKLAILDNTFDPNYIDNCNRPTWAHTFQSNANGGRFTAVMLHLKSKGSACAATADGQSAATDDGQGNGYIARRNAANAIVSWLGTNPTSIAESDVLLMGDFNAYASEEPLTILETGGYANLFSKDVYSYQFDGQWGSLDQAIGSVSLRNQVTGQTKWHINSDEPTVLDYNTEFKSAAQKSSFYNADPFRSSDHDPILIGLNLTADAPLPVTVTLTPDVASKTVTTGGASVTQSFTSTLTNATGDLDVTVTPVGDAPSIVSAPATATSGVSFDVTVQAPESTTPGVYEYTVTTSNGSASDSSTLTVTVEPAPLVTVTLTPATASQTVTVNGASATQRYTASGTNLSGDLTITVTPVGSAPAIVSAPTTATDGTPFDVTILAPAGTAAGTHTYTITAANSGQSSSSTLSITVNPEPSISLSGANKSVVTGATTTTTVTVIRTNFTATVNLSVTSVDGIGTAPSVTVTTPPGTGNTATLTIDAAGATVGTYTVTVFADGSGIEDTTTTFTVTVLEVPPTGLIFSEYVEGTSNNKAIEIYNGTGQTLAANRVSVKLYANGASTTSNTYTIGVELAPGQTFVITNASSNTTLAAKSNATSGVTNFNGDDALELLIDTTVVDTFGQVGTDPGTAWTGGTVTTLDKTLRRKSSVTIGDTNGSDAFDPSVQWDVYPVDSFDGLGAR